MTEISKIETKVTNRLYVQTSVMVGVVIAFFFGITNYIEILLGK